MENESENKSDPTVVDLTSYQLHDLDSVELPGSVTELDLTTNRLSALDPRIGQLPNLKKLSLRQNLFTDAAVEPLSSWHLISDLQELVLRDNQLKKIPDVAIFKKLLVFDVSFNEISSLNGLSKVSSTLRELYVSKNEVTKMEEIEHFHELQILELGSNRLRIMEHLQNMKNLQELWLGRNRIKTVDLCGLKCIKKISLQSNRLTCMVGFQECVALEELYLSHNGIVKMEGLSTLVNLRVLDISANKLTEINDIENLTNLEDLWLNDNNIASVEGVAEAVAGAREKLTTIYLERNPCVIKYEAVIHEFDPYFNYRVTQFLTKNGIYDFWNWFDDRTWYPLGRVIGGTVYPGLTLTAGTLWWILNSLNIPLSVETICIFTAPIFSVVAAWATYLLTKEVKGSGAGLTAAALLAIVPSYISRSVAGSYDNEAVAIFALIFTFYLYIKALNTGSLFYATLNALAYFYMVIVGTLLASLVPVVGFNAVMTSEHFASFLVFIIINVVGLVHYIKGILSPNMFNVAVALIVSTGLIVCCAVVAVLIAVVSSSPTKGWSGRSLSLLDPTYAKKYIPIIASVSEHQPPTWPTYFMYMNVLVFLVPAGIVACFLPLTDASSFMVLYLVTSVYFSAVMVRLMLVLAPAACIMSGIALSAAFDAFTRSIKFSLIDTSQCSQANAGDTSKSIAQIDVVKLDTSEEPLKEKLSQKMEEKENVERAPIHSQMGRRLLMLPVEASVVSILLLVQLGAFYVVHCVWVAEAYSAPSIVLTSHSDDGLHVYDDFREAYAWLSHNTDVDDKVASWWDYGYQTTSMANRTVIIDNNTWNNSHIAIVGTAMSSPENAAWEIFNSLDVKYVLIVFGGHIGYPSDDINKFLWMVRIGGGVFPHIKESDYLRDGQLRVDSMATPAMLNCLLYKLSYYRFVGTDGKGFDKVRQTEIGKKYFKLTHFEEVFTTHHWMVRIYKLKPPKNRIHGKMKRSKLKTKLTSSKRTGTQKKNPWH